MDTGIGNSENTGWHLHPATIRYSIFGLVVQTGYL